MNSDDLQLLVWSANEFEKYLAPLSTVDRARAVPDQIRQAHICYAVWKDGEGYRLRRLKAITSPRGRVGIAPASRSITRRPPTCWRPRHLTEHRHLPMKKALHRFSSELRDRS